MDARTPVLIGSGQVMEPVQKDVAKASSAVDLAGEAARRAIEDAGADTGADTSLAANIDTIVGIRTFPDSSSLWPNPFGSSNNFPRSVAARINATPTSAVYGPVGGNTPQALVNEFAEKLAGGEAEMVLIAGGEAIANTKAAMRSGEALDWRENIDGQLDDRGPQMEGMLSDEEVRHQLIGTPPAYALFEVARRANLGMTSENYAQSMGELLAPFSEVAASNPFSMFPERWSAAEIAVISARNSIISAPYTRAMVAKDSVNQGAAVLMTTAEKAHALGVPEEQWAYLRGYADTREKPILERQDLGASPAMRLAYEHALACADITIDDIGCMDIYSCFPIAVFAACDALELAPDEPSLGHRGLTLTGGLPFFGGPGNNYSLHAIAEVIQRLRAAPGSFGLIGANGGFLSKQSVGVYASQPDQRGWRPSSSEKLQAEINGLSSPPIDHRPEGAATIETYTVTFKRGQPQLAIVIGSLSATGARFIANSFDGDEETLQSMLGQDMEGRRIFVTALDTGNRFALGQDRLNALRVRHRESAGAP